MPVLIDCVRPLIRINIFVFLSPGAIAWNGELLCSGSRDRSILQRDSRSSEPCERKLVGHRQEVGARCVGGSICSLKLRAYLHALVALLSSWCKCICLLIKRLQAHV